MNALLEGGCLNPQNNGTTLKLPDAVHRLPILANHWFLVGEAKRADVIWSEGDFKALFEHMLNENPLSHFLNVWVDANGQARFTRNLSTARRADRHTSWAWDTITGRAKTPTSIGFYPTNPDGQSRWAALDFDAHNGEHQQARKWSLDAFKLLLNQPQLYLTLCTSGNGFHLFIIARELYPVGQWIVLLKQVCDAIGATITDGACELFPNERAGSHRVGKAIRGPGTWNPKTRTCSMIEAETVTPLLETLPRKWTRSCVGKLPRAIPRNNTEVSLHREVNNFSFYSPSTEKKIKNILARYPITQKGTRNGVMVKLIGELIYKFGREAVQRIAEEFYRLNQQNIQSTLEEHLGEFATAWASMLREVLASFSQKEQEAFARLEKSENQREGFLIARAFAGLAEKKRETDFPISQASLANRLSMTPPGAGKVIRKLCELNIIARTQPSVIYKQSARFCWLLPRSEPKAQRQVAEAFEAMYQNATLTS
jgi:hypothetical protein